MIHPSHASANPRRRHAAIWVGSGCEGRAYVASGSGTRWFSDREALLRHLTSAHHRWSHAWLTPRSQSDWAAFVPALDAAGWALSVGYRCGLMHSLYARLGARTAVATDEEEPTGRAWVGRSAVGVFEPTMLSPKDEAERTYEAILEADRIIRERWPRSAGLSATPALTGANIFASCLDSEIGCSPQHEVTLREASAYHGARIHLGAGVEPGSMWEAPPGGRIVDLDITSAYPTALELVPVGAEYVGEGPTDDYLAPCSISWCEVNVPGMTYPPLVVSNKGVPTYPTGRVHGAWTSAELRAAEAVGCEVDRVTKVWRYLPRREFVVFGAGVKRLRAELPIEHPLRPLSKLLGVATVGGWGMRPASTVLVVGALTEEMIAAGATPIGPCLHEVAVKTRQNRRALLPAAAMVTGTVRAWIGLAMHALSQEGCRLLYVHTDGTVVIEHKQGAIAQALAWVAQHSGLPVSAWKQRELHTIKLWAPGRRYELRADGTERWVPSGLEREDRAQ